MFGFGKKISIEEKAQWDQQLKDLLEKEEYEAAAKKAKEYEKQDKAAAAYFLALLYFKGQGVKQDLDKAEIFITRYKERYGDDPEGWYNGSHIMLAMNKPEDAIEWLVKAEQLGKEEATKSLAELCGVMGLNYRNAAWLSAKVTDYRELNEKAFLCFTRAIQKYHNVYEKNQAILAEEDWMQLGFVVHYMHYLALSASWPDKIYKDATVGPDIEKAYQMPDRAVNDRTPEYWKEVAEKAAVDMDKAGHKVHAAYTRAMLATNEADLKKSGEAIELAKQYLDQACELAGEQSEKYKDDYEVVWTEYNRQVKLLNEAKNKDEKKGIFGRKRH